MKLLPLVSFGTPSSPTPSLEIMTFTPPTTHSKGKGKVGKSIWEDPTMTLGQAHCVITNDKLKGLSSIPSHELVDCHIHKLVQVLGESPHLMTDYLSSEEKIVVANSKVDLVEAESSRLRKDLVEAMEQATKAKEKVKELKDALKVEKKLIIQKDDEVQAALLKTDEEHEKVITKFLKSNRFFDLQFVQYFKSFELLCRWMMKHHSQVADFANLDFEAIDTDILSDETEEKEGEAIADDAKGDGIAIGGVVDEAHMDEGHVEEVVTAP
nr:hypothetical protein CFP56_55356 [Quercus suber]